MASYDLIVIGSCPGGYVCAIRAAQLGLKVACVEGRETLGGTCLNIGCIPSKALLHASHMLHEAEHNFATMGLKGKSPSVDWTQMQAYKTDTIGQNTKGIEFLFKKNKVDWLKGWGSIPAPGQVKVGDEVHAAKNIIIASGSEPSSLPGVEVDEQVVVTSTGALSLKKVPKKLGVIGAGVIGLELGSVYKRLGSEVTVIEFLDYITPGMDMEVSKQFQKLLKKQGLEFIMGAAVQKTEATKTKAKVHYKLRKDDSDHVLDADVVLVATGRKPFTDGLGLAALGIEMEPRGQIKVGADWQTNVKGIYAIGDCISGPMLAHKAVHEGKVAAEVCAGENRHFYARLIPSVAYTDPEVAWCGVTETEAKAKGIKFEKGVFPWAASGKALSNGRSEGITKLLFDPEDQRVIGACIVGTNAGDLLAEACLAIEMGADAIDLGHTIHSHPTLSETVNFAAEMFEGTITDLMPPKKRKH